MPQNENKLRQAARQQPGAVPAVPGPPSGAVEEERPRTATEVFQDDIRRNIEAIGLSLPLGMNAQQFGRYLLTAANTHPGLFECNRRSFIAAGVTCAQLGLVPNDPRGLAYLVPFKDNNRGGQKFVQVIIGYQGYMELSHRADVFPKATAVCKGDSFRYWLGIEEGIEHVRSETSDPDDYDELTHTYAVAKVAEGQHLIEVLTRAQIEKLRKRYGQGNKKSAWETDTVAMAKKSAIRRLAKWLPKSTELALAASVDDRPMMIGDLGMVEAMDVPDDAPDDDGKHPDALPASATEAPPAGAEQGTLEGEPK
jgi:recombination protein RecT